MFLFKKKKDDEVVETVESVGIYVLGSGCKKCVALKENTEKALSYLNLNESVKHISDFRIIAAFSVLSTPALVIDKKVVSSGSVLSKNEVLDIIKNYRG